MLWCCVNGTKNAVKIWLFCPQNVCKDFLNFLCGNGILSLRINTNVFSEKRRKPLLRGLRRLHTEREVCKIFFPMQAVVNRAMANCPRKMFYKE